MVLARPFLFSTQRQPNILGQLLFKQISIDLQSIQCFYLPFENFVWILKHFE